MPYQIFQPFSHINRGVMYKIVSASVVCQNRGQHTIFRLVSSYTTKEMKIQPMDGNSCGDEPDVGEEPTRSKSLTSAAANEINSAEVISVKPLEASANILLEDALIDQDKIVIHQDPNDGHTFGILCCCSCDLLSAGDVTHYEISDKFGRRLMEGKYFCSLL